MRWKSWRTSASTSTVSFPGTTATVSLSDRESSGGHWFTMIHDRRAQQVTIVLEALAEPALWMRLFSSHEIDMGEANDVLSLSATWDAYAANRLSLRIAITFAVVSKKGLRDLGDQAVEIGVRLPAIIGSLMKVGLPVRPLDTAGYTATLLEYLTGSPDGGVEELDQAWQSVHETYISARHGDVGAVSLTLGPRHVTAETLGLLCVPATKPGSGLRTTVTYRPLDVDAHEESATTGKGPHTLGLFGAIVTVASTDPLDVDASDALTDLRDRLPLSVRLGLRRGYASQAALLAAGAGAGVLLPDAIDLSSANSLAARTN
jgi:hypothetical protein